MQGFLNILIINNCVIVHTSFTPGNTSQIDKNLRYKAEWLKCLNCICSFFIRHEIINYLPTNIFQCKLLPPFDLFSLNISMSDLLPNEFSLPNIMQKLLRCIIYRITFLSSNTNTFVHVHALHFFALNKMHLSGN